MTGANSSLELQTTIKELKEIQSKFFDQATNYTKLVLSLGYGGFFAAWSITRQYLPPRRMVWSILFLIISLLVFILFEIWQTWTISSLSLRFAGAKVSSDAEVIVAQRRFSEDYAAKIKTFAPVWRAVFLLTVLTGLTGAVLMVSGLISALLRMH